MIATSTNVPAAPTRGALRGRWDGVHRPYATADVTRLRGSVKIEYTLAQRGAARLWELLTSRDYLPALGDNARAWLFGVARNVLANQHRAARRSTDLAARLRHELGVAIVAAPEVPAEISAAFATLKPADQELLRLVAWEGLTPEELAVALDCSANAARIRLHRARTRFAEALRSPSLTK